MHAVGLGIQNTKPINSLYAAVVMVNINFLAERCFVMEKDRAMNCFLPVKCVEGEE